MKSDKQDLRTRFLKMRKALSKESVENRSYRIIQKLKKLVRPDVSVLMFYVPINNEVDLIPLAEEFYHSKKTILFPRMINNDTIVPYIIHDLYYDFKKGAFNIPEPDTEPYKGKIDIIFVPGVVFGRDGHRIGYGKAFFDRFLDHADSGMNIGVCYDFQLLKSVPHTDHDYPMDWIVSDHEIVQFPKP
jgi:5-formyltetrahydrofolate cyclo-ligase